MTTVLPLLLLLGLGCISAFGPPSDCSPTKSLSESDVETIKTVTVTRENQLLITTEVDVYPHEGFQGVSLRMDGRNGTSHVVWFPNDTCWQWESGWRKLKVEVQSSKDELNNCSLIFLLSINKCLLWCKKEANFTSLQSLSIVGYGSSDWMTTDSDDCTTTAIYSEHQHSFCLVPPPLRISTTNHSHNTTSLHPPSPLTANRGTGASGSEVVVAVGWVVGVVAIVTTVVVTVVVMWRIWRDGSASSNVIRSRSRPLQELPQRCESKNSLYEPFSNIDNGQETIQLENTCERKL